MCFNYSKISKGINFFSILAALSIIIGTYYSNKSNSGTLDLLGTSVGVANKGIFATRQQSVLTFNEVMSLTICSIDRYQSNKCSDGLATLEKENLVTQENFKNYVASWHTLYDRINTATSTPAWRSSDGLTNIFLILSFIFTLISGFVKKTEEDVS